MPKYLAFISFAVLATALATEGRAQQISAANDLFLRAEERMAEGPVLQLERNTIVVDDQKEMMVKRLICFRACQNIHKGDRVRAYYRPEEGNRVTLVNVLAPLKHAPGQNLGYVGGQPPDLVERASHARTRSAR